MRYQSAICSASGAGIGRLIKAAALGAAAGLVLLSACEVFQPGAETLQQFEQPPADTIAADLIKPRTPEATAAIKQIGAKLEVDRMNAKSYTGSDGQIGLYYTHKAAELQFLKNQLESNQSISKQQLTQALDDKEVLEYGGSP